MSMVFKITDFEGPLDLLLHLVREKNVEIKFVPLAEVTGQFLEYMGQLNKLDLDAAAEFIDIASTLVEIKSRNILPKPAKEEESIEDIELRLKQQLEEYKLLKEASEKLKEIENVDRFYKEPQELKPEYKYVMNNLSLDMLTEAFSRIMHKIKQSAAIMQDKQIKLDRFTVKDKIGDIRERISIHKQVMFFDLFEADFTKSEMINTFLALLELLKTGEISVSQESIFSDIVIKGVANDTISAEN